MRSVINLSFEKSLADPPDARFESSGESVATWLNAEGRSRKQNAGKRFQQRFEFLSTFMTWWTSNEAIKAYHSQKVKNPEP